MAPETKYVFVETEVFDHHQLDFGSPRIRRLVRLASSGDLELILSDVTVSEIETHLAETATAAVKQLADLRKLNRGVREIIGADKLAELTSLTEEELSKRLMGDLKQFLEETKATVVGIDDVRPSDVFKRYFKGHAPFNKAKKKSEFPDAFAAAALESWCKGPPVRKLYVVSGDDDWRRLSEQTEGFIHVGRLDELLEKFADSEAVSYLKETINSENQELLQLLTGEIENGNVYFYVDDSVVDGEVEEVENSEITVEDVNVIEAKDGKATVGLLCRVGVTLAISGMDPDSTWRDPDDGSLHSVWKARGSVEREFEMEATVEVSYDAKAPHKISIDSASFQESDMGVSVEEDELQTDYDDDEYEEFDPQTDDLSDETDEESTEF